MFAALWAAGENRRLHLHSKIMGKKRVIKQSDTEALEEAKRGGGETAESASGDQASPKQKRGKITKMAAARIYIAASYNNTMVSITDAQGNLLLWATAGSLGFKGPKKATPYAASRVIDDIFTRLGNVDLGKVSIYARGIGGGRDAALRALATRGLDIAALEDITPIPHNGCRPKKARRV